MPPSGLPRRLGLAFFTMGLVATATQILLLRRLIGVLYGNEMVVGGALAVWMIGTGAGSAVAAAWASRERAGAQLAVVTFSAIVLLPLTLLGTYAVRAIQNIPAGQVISPGVSFFICVLLVLPLTALLGAMFVFFSVLDIRAREERVGIVYLLEALGAAVGGVASGLAASWGAPPFAWSFLVAVGLLAILWMTAPAGRVWRTAGCAAVVAMALLTWGPGKVLTDTADGLAWPGQRLMTTVESRYASLAVTERGGQRTLFVDALPGMTYPNRRDAEQTVHTALLQHPNPRRVLLVGGGLSQAASEAFKHGVESLDYVQIDPAITRLERDYLRGGGDWRSGAAPRDFFKDPRVSVHNVDGRLFVNESRGEAYDVVIVDTPDPATVLLNRFYTMEFFSRVKALLNRDGVLAFTCGEMANYVGRSLGRLLACESTTLQMSFRHQRMLPLAAIHFVASDSPRWLTADGNELARRLEDRNVSTTFMRDYYLSYDLSPQRVEYLSTELSKARTAESPKVNTDRYPVGYFYYLAHWYTLLGSVLAAAMETSWGQNADFSVPIAAVLVFLLSAIPGLRRRHRVARAVAVVSMGFATLTSQIVILIALQTFRGHLFHSVGLVIAAHMVGISLGALWTRRRAGGGSMAFPQALLAWYCVALAAAVFLPLDRLAGGSFVLLAALASLLGGVAGGAVFQRAAIAAALPRVVGHGNSGVHPGPPDRGNHGDSYATPSHNSAGAAGLLNACDHLGAALGALAAASIILPALGLSGAAALAAATAGGSALGLALARL